MLAHVAHIHYMKMPTSKTKCVYCSARRSIDGNALPTLSCECAIGCHIQVQILRSQWSYSCREVPCRSLTVQETERKGKRLLHQQCEHSRKRITEPAWARTCQVLWYIMITEPSHLCQYKTNKERKKQNKNNVTTQSKQNWLAIRLLISSSVKRLIDVIFSETLLCIDLNGK